MASASVVNLDPDKGVIRLAPSADVYRDSTRSLTIEDVSQPSFQSRFVALTTPDLFAHADETLWIRLQMETRGRPDPMTIGWVLEVGNSRFEGLALFFVPDHDAADGIGNRVQRIGAHIPHESGHNRPFFVLSPMDEAVGRYYLSLQAHATMPVPMDLRSVDGFRRYAEWQAQIFGGVYGVLLAMFLFNGFIFVSLRDRIYLYYVTYIGCMLAYLHCLNGQHRVLLKLQSQSGSVMMWICLGAVGFFAMVFVKAFLETKRATPILNHLLSAVQVGALGVVVFGAVGAHGPAHVMAMLTGIGVGVGGLATGIVRVSQGYRPARYFLVAWSVLLLGVTTLPLKEYGFLPQSLPGELATNIGAAAESILLSFALADRIRVLRREKEELVVSRAHYRKASLTDELTGLFNYRYFKERLGRAVREVGGSERPLSLLMMDVDDFKRFNDAHGHQAGDEVLTRLAGLMRTSARESDAPCRYGGEEFVLLLPETTLEAAGGVAERLRQEFEAQLFEVGSGAGAKTSISIGVAQLADGELGDRLIQRADAALYRAKSKGKNRVELES